MGLLKALNKSIGQIRNHRGGASASSLKKKKKQELDGSFPVTAEDVVDVEVNEAVVVGGDVVDLPASQQPIAQQSHPPPNGLEVIAEDSSPSQSACQVGSPSTSSPKERIEAIAAAASAAITGSSNGDEPVVPSSPVAVLIPKKNRDVDRRKVIDETETSTTLDDLVDESTSYSHHDDGVVSSSMPVVRNGGTGISKDGGGDNDEDDAAADVTANPSTLTTASSNAITTTTGAVAAGDGGNEVCQQQPQSSPTASSVSTAATTTSSILYAAAVAAITMRRGSNSTNTTAGGGCGGASISSSSTSTGNNNSRKERKKNKRAAKKGRNWNDTNTNKRRHKNRIGSKLIKSLHHGSNKKSGGDEGKDLAEQPNIRSDNYNSSSKQSHHYGPSHDDDPILPVPSTPSRTTTATTASISSSAIATPTIGTATSNISSSSSSAASGSTKKQRQQQQMMATVVTCGFIPGRANAATIAMLAAAEDEAEGQKQPGREQQAVVSKEKRSDENEEDEEEDEEVVEDRLSPYPIPYCTSPTAAINTPSTVSSTASSSSSSAIHKRRSHSAGRTKKSMDVQPCIPDVRDDPRDENETTAVDETSIDEPADRTKKDENVKASIAKEETSGAAAITDDDDDHPVVETSRSMPIVSCSKSFELSHPDHCRPNAEATTASEDEVHVPTPIPTHKMTPLIGTPMPMAGDGPTPGRPYSGLSHLDLSGAATAPGIYYGPPSNSSLSAKKQFWERVFRETPCPNAAPGNGGGGKGIANSGADSSHPSSARSSIGYGIPHSFSSSPSSSSSSDDDLLPHPVLHKKRWLEQAFTPQGCGNMKQDDVEESYHALERSRLLRATSSTSSTAGDESSSSSPTSTLITSPPRPISTFRARQHPEFYPSVLNDCVLSPDDPWNDAYHLWYKKGLLSWCPSTATTATTVSSASASSTPVAPPRGTEGDTTSTNTDGDGITAVKSQKILSDIEARQKGMTLTSSGKWVLLETVDDFSESSTSSYIMMAKASLEKRVQWDVSTSVSTSFEDDEDDILDFFKRKQLPREGTSDTAQDEFCATKEVPSVDHPKADEKDFTDDKPIEVFDASVILGAMMKSRGYSQRRSNETPMLTLFGGTWTSTQSSDPSSSPTAASTASGQVPAVSTQRLEAFKDYVAAYKEYIHDRRASIQGKRQPIQAHHREREARKFLAVTKAI